MENTNQELYDQLKDVWPEDEPVDMPNNPIVAGYYESDLGRVALANKLWIQRVRANYPELLPIVPAKESLPNRVKKLRG